MTTWNALIDCPGWVGLGVVPRMQSLAFAKKKSTKIATLEKIDLI
jgi:hypothetical protein